jgi:menaquinone-specific isochorismate synthase
VDEKVCAWLDLALGRRDAAERVLRIEIPVTGIDPLEWLHAQSSPVKTFWSDRDSTFRMAGAGIADSISSADTASYEIAFARLEQRLAAAEPGVRFYGGSAFDLGARTDARWMRFGAYRFVVPRFEVLETAGQTCFACNVLQRGDSRDLAEFEAVRNELAQLRFTIEQPVYAIPAIRSRTDRPDRASWEALVNDALIHFRRHDVEKVVLARESLLEFGEPVEPTTVLGRLDAGKGNAYLFCFQPEPGFAFVGASPERLYQRDGDSVQTEALAGTRPRGATEEADAVFGNALLHNDKELREHRFVSEGIRGVLEALCDDVRSETSLSLVRLHDCQHLVCRFEGRLRAGRSDADLIRTLHPTPAVGGTPTVEALAWIRGSEPFDRGWYAGPVGWIGAGASEFAVGIRSGLLDARTISLYSGAGIVPGSIPEQEWEEVENKMAMFLSALSR